MTVTKDQAQMLATLAAACRPVGARQWKPDDVLAEIGKIADRALPTVACAVIRAAADRGAERPSVIASAGSHWGDAATVTTWTPNFVPREHRCSVCGMSETACRIRHSVDDHEFRSAAMAAKEREAADPESVHTAVAALREGIEAVKDPTPPKTLDDLRATNPKFAAKLDAVRAALPAAPMREPEPAEGEPSDESKEA